MVDQTKSDSMTSEGFDVIGDVHGEADKLDRLLTTMGYVNDGDGYRFPQRRRQAIFVGDLIDRGREQRQTIDIVRSMVVSGDARIVMGNHEYNAIAYAMPDPDSPGEYLRRHEPKNDKQHAAFITAFAFGSGDHDAVIDWFRSMPLWLELDGLRVVHACWDQAVIDDLGGDPYLTDKLMVSSSVQDSIEQRWVEVLCKGPEIPLPDGITFEDMDGHIRSRARFRWWDPAATTYRVACEVPPSCPQLPDRTTDHLPVQPYTAHTPVLFGHYWRKWEHQEISEHTACVDYSAVLGGPLSAYRWSGEKALTADHLAASW